MTANVSKLIAAQLAKGKNKQWFDTGDAEHLLSDIPYYISTGCWPLDAIMGKGIPGSRIIEIYGDESTGKSLLGLSLIASVQQNGGAALFLDTETTTQREFMERMGVDVPNLIISTPNTIEDVYDVVGTFLVEKQKVDEELGMVTPAVIVWDSLASTTTESEEQAIAKGGLGKPTIALAAKAISVFMRTAVREFAIAGVTLVIINQVRTNIGVMFGDKDVTFGGNALKFYSSVRMRLTTIRQYKENDNTVGIQVRAHIKKNKVDRPFGTCEFPLLFIGGMDNAVACFWYLKHENQGMIATKGAWHYMELGGKEEKFQSKGWRELFDKHTEEIKEIILNKLEVQRAEEIQEEDDEQV